MSLILSGTDGLSDVDGSASTPAIRGTDTNTGIFFPAADTIAFAEGGAEVARFDSSGNLGINTTNPTVNLEIGSNNSTVKALAVRYSSVPVYLSNSFDGTLGLSTLSTNNYNTSSGSSSWSAFQNTGYGSSAIQLAVSTSGSDIRFLTASASNTNPSERMRIDSDGRVGVGCTPTGSAATQGIQLIPSGVAIFTRSADLGIFVNRLTNDGQLIQFRQDSVEEGNISVSGTTVSYNGGHLSRYAQTLEPTNNSLLKGTVLSNLDEMNEYVNEEGNPVANEQLNKVKVSDVEGDINVAGVFVNWSHDESHNLDEINMAMTGDMIIRIAEGVVVQKGDLLMSAGDGTAKPQGDDIVRSKTIAKVTSNHVTCTYEDGSYCVPCVLMAC